MSVFWQRPPPFDGESSRLPKIEVSAGDMEILDRVKDLIFFSGSGQAVLTPCTSQQTVEPSPQKSIDRSRTQRKTNHISLAMACARMLRYLVQRPTERPTRPETPLGSMAGEASECRGGLSLSQKYQVSTASLPRTNMTFG